MILFDFLEIKKKKKTNVSKSSSDARYKAIGTTGCELQSITYIFQDVHVQTNALVVFYRDNQSTHHITYNPNFHKHTKRIELHYQSLQKS